MELTSAVRSVSSSNKCNGMITAARKNQADALNPHPPHGESFFLSPSLSKRIYATSLQYQFGCGISKIVGPKKQDFWPRINILKGKKLKKFFL